MEVVQTSTKSERLAQCCSLTQKGDSPRPYASCLPGSLERLGLLTSCLPQVECNLTLLTLGFPYDSFSVQIISDSRKGIQQTRTFWFHWPRSLILLQVSLLNIMSRSVGVIHKYFCKCSPAVFPPFGCGQGCPSLLTYPYWSGAEACCGGGYWPTDPDSLCWCLYCP